MSPRLIALLALSVACSPPGVMEDAGAGPRPNDSGFVPLPDGGTQPLPDGGPVPGFDGGPLPSDAAPPPPATETTPVSHDREIRGGWIATVHNINWPSRTGLGASAMQAELNALLDTALSSGLNAVFFQVRAEADAFYRSDLEPFSRFLTGTQGQDPGFDPLEYAVQQAHQRGLELHAWMNPYRALASGNSAVASSTHVLNAERALTVDYGDLYWLDPGNPRSLERTMAVIRDVLTRYDIDGLHFDDYFYPYPQSGVPFNDSASHAAHGGGMSRDDWRRDNVNRMVSSVHQAVQELRPDVRFGISPFGIYRPGMPSGITGLDQYGELYADPPHWVQQRWVDYIAPQLYWPTTQSAQAYGSLLNWWATQTQPHGRYLIIGNYLSQLGSSGSWTLNEFRQQIQLVRSARPNLVRGNIFYHVGPLTENRSGVRDMVRNDFYNRPAATPPLADATTAPPAAPYVQADGDGAIVQGAPNMRHWAAYLDVGGGVMELRSLFPGSATRVALGQGRWAISAIDRHGLESLGSVVVVTSGTTPPDPMDPPDPVDPPPTGGTPCSHTFGGNYAHSACSASYQCCNGSWVMSLNSCGSCLCVEPTGMTGCGT